MRFLFCIAWLLIVFASPVAGFDFDRRASEMAFDCGTLFESPCGIESADNAAVVRDSVTLIWKGDYNDEYGVFFADRSSDGGGTWGTDITGIDQQASIVPRVIAASLSDPANVIVAWVTYDVGGMSLFLDVSYDWMRSFEYSRKDLRVARGVANTSAADVAIGNSDTLVAVYARGDTLWAKFSTLDDPNVWSDSLALFASTNSMDQVDVEAGADGDYGVVWREKIGGLGSIRSLTFDRSGASMLVEPQQTNVVERGKPSRPFAIIERPALNTLIVSDDPAADYDQPCLRYLIGEPAAWWVGFHDARGRVLIDRRAATPTGEWGTDIVVNAPNSDMPALAVAQEGGIEFVIAAYRQWGTITLYDLGEFDGAAFTWIARESVSAGHGADRVNGHSVVVLGLNPLRFGVAYTPINHNGVGSVWFKGFTYEP